MRYSLLSRFRGGLLGSWIGENLDSTTYQWQVGFPAKLPHRQKTQNLEKELTHTLPTISDWTQIGVCAGESLIRYGRLEVNDWMLEIDRTQSSLIVFKGTAKSSETALATLPIALFFHDNPIRLRQHLLQASVLWQSQPDASSGVLAVALAIALALTEKLNPATLIPQILVELGISQTPLVRKLEQVQTLVEQGADLETTLTQLRQDQGNQGKQQSCSDTPIALAFYCFLTTPEDFRLAVTRAIRSNDQPQTTAALTGALSGVYNSISGIPVGWRISRRCLTSGIQRLELSDRLFAVWSGVCDSSAAKGYNAIAVAAPGVIQPRS
ncbi:MAG TPA: ADP-ribosylglycohydrolase family protein [Cyanobacteria bacterium UBA11162]|nr:ADP-ribosylglycohydrolase family protein [Cyanobacteria bacterium UBA11162]